MSTFDIYSFEKSHLAESLEFPNYIEANKYVSTNYDSSYISSVDELKWTKTFNKLTNNYKSNEKVEIVNGKHSISLIRELDTGNVYHCGKISVGELERIKLTGIKPLYISYREFIYKVQLLGTKV